MSKLTTVPFHEDTLFAVETTDGVFVAVKPISDGLGLKWSGQHDRLNRDPILAEGIRVMRIPSPGGEQETTVLSLALLQGWLFGIDVGRVKPEARDIVLAYKRECYAVLFRHFYGTPAETRAPLHAPTIAARQEPTRIRKQLVTEARAIWGERVAGRLWWELDLPIVEGMATEPAQSSFGFTYTALPTPERPQDSSSQQR